jgi:hypothetical protein
LRQAVAPGSAGDVVRSLASLKWILSLNVSRNVCMLNLPVVLREQWKFLPCDRVIGTMEWHGSKALISTNKFFTESLNSEDKETQHSDDNVKLVGVRRSKKALQTVKSLSPTIERKKPPLEKLDANFFVAAGMQGDGEKLEHIRVAKRVSIEECEAMFGATEGTGHKKFRYTNYRDRKVVQRVENIWLLLHSKRQMPSNALLSLEFVMDIVAETKNIRMNWAAFCEQQNVKQRVGYQNAVDEIVRERAQLLALQVKEETQDSILKVTATDLVRGVREFHLQLEQAGFPAVRVSSTFTARWAQKLAIEVGDLLRLAAVESWSAKQEANQMLLEERHIIEEARCEMNVMDSFLAASNRSIARLSGVEGSTAVHCLGGTGLWWFMGERIWILF